MPTRPPGKSGVRRRRRVLRPPSPALVVAILALLVATAQSAYGVSNIRHYPYFNSVDIIDNTLTGRDIKNKSLTKADFRGSFQGPRGLRGPSGPRGLQGAPGGQGPQGPKGDNGTNGTNGTNGSDAIPNLTYVRTASTPAPTGGVNAGAFAECPSGQRPIAGGVVTSDGLINVYQTAAGTPTAFEGTPTGWWGSVRNFGGVPGTFRAYAVCAPANATSTYGVSGRPTVSPAQPGQ